MNLFFEKNSYYKQHHIDLLDDINNIIFDQLTDQTYEYKDADYSLFYFITEYIAFLSSLPSLPRYDNIKMKKDEIHTRYREIIDPINEEKLNLLKLKLGLGWKGIPRFDPKGEEYSMHHYFYIDNKGKCFSENNNNRIILRFDKIMQPDIYSLQMDNDFYLTINNDKIDSVLSKLRVLPTDGDNFHFKLKLTGNEQNQIIIKPGNDKYGNYLLTSYHNNNNNNNEFKFISKINLKAENIYKFKIL